MRSAIGRVMAYADALPLIVCAPYGVTLTAFALASILTTVYGVPERCRVWKTRGHRAG